MIQFVTVRSIRPRPLQPIALTIAGSDSGGGAGLQADIKTVTMLGGFAMTAITAVTVQNTLGVRAVHPVPTDIVVGQIDAVAEDLGVDAVKIGMIGSPETAPEHRAATPRAPRAVRARGGQAPRRCRQDPRR